MTTMGWRKVRLGDVFENRKQRGEGGLPTLSVTISSGVMDREQLDRKTDSALAPEEHLLVEPGDIAYNTMRMWQGASGLIGMRAIVSPAYVVLKPTDDIDSRFASYLFKTQRMIHLFWAYSHGLTDDRRRLYFDDFASIPVTIPPLDEQVRIAAALSIWDQAIDVTDRLIEKSEAQRRALMQTLLRKEAIPRRLGELAEIDARSLGADTPGSYEFRYVSLSDVSVGRISPNLRRLQFGSAPSRARRIVNRGDVLLATVRPNLQAFAHVREDAENLVASTGFAVLTPKAGVSAEFLYHSLFSEFVESQIDGLVVGSNYPAINSTDVAQLQVLCPSEERQVHIGHILRCAEAACQTLRGRLTILQQERRALLQQVLTGKRRISTKEEAA